MRRSLFGWMRGECDRAFAVFDWEGADDPHWTTFILPERMPIGVIYSVISL